MGAEAKSRGGYGPLLRDGGFEAFLWTQFLGAFNDNVYKMMVSILAVEIAANRQLGARYLSISLAVFVLPFLLFAGPAGQLADRFSKTRVLQITKALEIVTMALGLSALLLNRIELLLGVLFLLATQANFFSPAKYGILPEMMSEAEITPANGLVEFSTLAAIVLGTSFGVFLIGFWKHDPWKMGGTLLAIAVIGTLTSLRIPKVPPSGSAERFHWNPFQEVWLGALRLKENRALWLTVFGISYFWFIGALFQMAVLLLGKEALHASETSIGYLSAALAVGIGVGSITAGWFSREHIELGLVPLGSFLLGLFSIVLSSTNTYGWATIWLVAIGVSGGLFFVPLNAFLQERAGNQEKGRILATNNFLNTAGMLLASGMLSLLHDRVHWPASYILGALGLVTLLATLYVLYTLLANSLRLLLFALIKVAFRVRVLGADKIPQDGGALLVSNHVSYVDAILIGCSTHRFVRFLMWKPYFHLKPLKPFLQVLRAIPIDPAAPKQMLRALHQASDELNSGELVCIFPEGGLTRTGHIRPFQRGIERVIKASPEAPVIPIYLGGLSRHPLAANGSRSIRSWIRAWRCEVTVFIGDPIRGRVSVHEIRQRVLELESETVALRKKPDSTLGHRLIKAARRKWSQPAMADSTKKRLNFGETLTAGILIRNWLNRAETNQQNIGLLLPTSVGGAVANFGITLAGRTAVNLNFTAGEQNVRAATELCEIRTVLTSRLFVEKANLTELLDSLRGSQGAPRIIYLEDLLRRFTRSDKIRAFITARFAPSRLILGRVTPDDIACIVFSSGSTGVPKGVELSHWNLVSNLDAVRSIFPINMSDSMLAALPLFHSFGYTFGLWFPLILGFPVVFHANPTDPKTIGELAAAHHPTFFLSTPTFCSQYTRKCTREQFSSFKYVLVGAEKLRESVAEEFEKKFGIRPLAGYGCTEVGPGVAVNTPDVVNGAMIQDGSREGSVGRPLPGVAVRVVDAETFQPLPEGEQGMLLVNGPSRMVGYYRAPEKTLQVLCNGYYVTGDLGYIDKDGYLYITDRLARFSKIGGEMVPHLKVEEALSDILQHTPCFVTGIPDEKRGERLAVLYTVDDITPAELIDHLQAADLPPLWIPKRENFYLVDAIPVLATGKVDLAGARALVMDRTAKGQSILQK
ncbi:MAG: MFS transporter [Acidobacteriaceae bacterium]|nr:MFS transporter [Acidobacteriaceae bacterium]MBV9780138.1 MFS transporter [Acidobacteriaceae bacterium]